MYHKNNKSIQRWKTRRTRSKYRRPILLIYLPSNTSMHVFELTQQRLQNDPLKKDYHLLIAVGQNTEVLVEVHGANKLTSFAVVELKQYIKEQMQP